MNYDLSKETDLNDFKFKVKLFINDKKKVSLTTKKATRSISQNSYLHIVITLYAIEFGYTLNESKTDLKRMCSFMVYEKENKKYLKETSKMNSIELTSFIDWIRNHAAKNGCYIPTSEEYLINKFSIDRDIQKVKEFL